MRTCYVSHEDSDREHSSIIASNFPDDASDNQIRHFFKEVQNLYVVISDTLVRYNKINWSCQEWGRAKIGHYWIWKRSIRLYETNLIHFRLMLHLLSLGIWRHSKGRKSLSRNTLIQYYGSQIIQQHTTKKGCEICSPRYQLNFQESRLICIVWNRRWCPTS